MASCVAQPFRPLSASARLQRCDRRLGFSLRPFAAGFAGRETHPQLRGDGPPDAACSRSGS